MLLRVMDRTGEVGIGRFVLRTKPHLVAIRATDKALMLETLFFSDEVRPSADIAMVADPEVSERELTIAEQLLGMLATTWDPSRYSDEYRQELLRLIDEKQPVQAPSASEPFVPGPGAEELMEALRRSVEMAKAQSDGRDRSRRTG